MKNMILAMLTLVFVCCVTIEPTQEAPPEKSTEAFAPTPWNCSVEIASLFEIPEDGTMTVPGTLFLSPAGSRMVMARGTGTVIAKEGSVLTILTAKHVVLDSKGYTVEADGTAAEGFGVKHLLDNDISIFYVDSVPLSEKRQVAPLAQSIPSVGTELSLVGNALGRGLVQMRSGPLASDKTVVAMGVKVWRGAYHSYPGCSGGGIWANGKLVGVVSMVSIFNGVVASDLGLFVGPEFIYPFAQK